MPVGAPPANAWTPETRPRSAPPRGPDKFNADIRKMVERALVDAGGAEYLRRQADENPVAFMGLVAKLLPRDVRLEVGQNLAELIAASWKAPALPASPPVIDVQAENGASPG